MKKTFLTLASLCMSLFASTLMAEDGSRAWLRYPTDAQAEVQTKSQLPLVTRAQRELQQAWKGQPVSLQVSRDASVRALGPEGFTIVSTPQSVVIASSSDRGLLYGAFHLLRLQATGADCNSLQVSESPAYQYRVLNHWDNLDRTVERGFAGRSLWEWQSLPDVVSPRYEAYARLNASIGINSVVLNNVNASPEILTAEYLHKVKVLADIFADYGIKVYLSINFSSPTAIGGLSTADPLNRDVQRWWKDKAREIYQLIPQFGGFLVKANSEGLPGPQDFGRTHADGANMLADALKPYGGIVMWRAFVYSPTDEDRAKQAYQEFKPLDGQFRDNVIVQIKNGPVDFQPREPFSPLFGATPRTQQMVEFQITQEYTGFSNHLCYLAPMWEECLQSDTYQQGPGTTIARVTTTPVARKKCITAIAGVANIGTDTNWCGHDFAQSNWYAFGRMAWNPSLTSQQIADEWVSQTFDFDAAAQQQVTYMMMESREAVVRYMMPLGLHHIFAGNHHYGPAPWYFVPGARPDWMPPYYHKADSIGLGFDRTVQTGSGATAQYCEPLASLYEHIETCPDTYLLWFHHAPWTHVMQSGRPLWDELCYQYDGGVKEVASFQRTWDRLESQVDAERFAAVQHKLRIQMRDAIWWKDACLLYFQQFSKLPIPYDIDRPQHNLDDMMQFELKIDNYTCPEAGFSK